MFVVSSSELTVQEAQELFQQNGVYHEIFCGLRIFTEQKISRNKKAGGKLVSRVKKVGTGEID